MSDSGAEAAQSSWTAVVDMPKQLNNNNKRCRMDVYTFRFIMPQSHFLERNQKFSSELTVVMACTDPPQFMLSPNPSPASVTRPVPSRPMDPL